MPDQPNYRKSLALTAADPFQVAADALERCDRLEKEIMQLRLALIAVPPVRAVSAFCAHAKARLKEATL